MRKQVINGAAAGAATACALTIREILNEVAGQVGSEERKERIARIELAVSRSLYGPKAAMDAEAKRYNDEVLALIFSGLD